MEEKNGIDLHQQLNAALMENEQLKTLLEETRRNALVDDLTDLPNRKFFEQYMKQLGLCAIKRIVKNKKIKNNQPFSLLFCDINGLKTVNDTMGHETADIGIKNIAEIIKDSIHHQENPDNTKEEFVTDELVILPNHHRNIAVRFGGDEFLILLFNCTKEQAEQTVVSRIKNNILNSLKATKNLSLSIGVACTSEIPINGNDVDDFFHQLITLAENRMYEDKNKNVTKEDKMDIIVKTIFRIGEKVGLDMNNDQDFSQLVNMIIESKQHIDEIKRR